MGIYIEIALSLILIFLVLSLVVTAINELIAIQLHKRPKMLLKTITALIDDKGLRDSFYANGIVVSAKTASAGQSIAVTDQDHPSYIAGRNFARALTMATLKRAGNQGPLGTFDIKAVATAVNALPANLKIRDVLIGALSSATASIEAFEAEVAAWYDTTQDRLTGEYARHQRWVTIIVGAVLVVFLNADAVRLTRELQANDALRTSMVEQAEALFEAGIVSECDAKEGDARESCLIVETRDLLGRLEPSLIGWRGDAALTAVGAVFAPSATAAEGAADAAAPLNPFGVLVNKLLGLVITVMAISLGAPFWFDMLNKVVNIRGAGVKPEKVAAQP